MGAPLLFLPAVFTIVGVEAPVGASLLFLPVVFTILGVQGVSVFLELLFLTMQTLVGAHCLGPQRPLSHTMTMSVPCRPAAVTCASHE